jgi:hypothetical protein
MSKNLGDPGASCESQQQVATDDRKGDVVKGN